MTPTTISDLLGSVDNAFYFINSPQTPMNIGAVTIFEGPIDFAAFLRWIEGQVYQAPLYQKRVIATPLNLGRPKWVYDPNFTVQNHVFPHDIEAPGGERAATDARRIPRLRDAGSFQAALGNPSD